MKIKILFFLIFPLFINAQTDVQVRFTTGNQNIYIVTTTPQDPPNYNYGNETTDAFLNTILQNHNVNTCYQSPYLTNGENVLFFRYDGVNISNFISDLENYNSTISKVNVCCQPEAFADLLILYLVNPNIGNPISYDSNGIVITNDSGLNSIFQTYGVTEMSLDYTSYSIIFNGNCNDLKNALLNYSSVLDNVELAGVVFLSTDSFNSNSFKIFPNPFENEINFTSKDSLTNIMLISIDGKIIGNYKSSKEINSIIPSLTQGVYLIELTDINNSKTIKKVVKK